MKTSVAILMLLFFARYAHSEEKWKTVDERFLMTIPLNWQKKKVECEDSNCGTYKAKTVDLDFDEVGDFLYTEKKAQSRIDVLKEKEANPKLLKLGEEIWRVDGKICSFWSGKLDSKVYGKRRFSNVATLFVPYAGKPGYLSIHVFYKSDKDMPTVKRVLKSIEWKKGSPTEQDKKAK